MSTVHRRGPRRPRKVGLLERRRARRGATDRTRETREIGGRGGAGAAPPRLRWHIDGSGDGRVQVEVDASTPQEVTFGIRPMPLNLARARALVFEVPRTAKLAYCLALDRRVPLRPKLAVGAALGLIVSPLKVPDWIPVIGDLDMLALGVLTVRVFVDACPQEVVEEHRAAVLRGQSLFDRDLRIAFALAQDGVGRLSSRRGASLVGRESRESEEQSA